MTKGFTEHWIEKCNRENRPFSRGYNPIRISAKAELKRLNGAKSC